MQYEHYVLCSYSCSCWFIGCWFSWRIQRRLHNESIHNQGCNSRLSSCTVHTHVIFDVTLRVTLVWTRHEMIAVYSKVLSVYVGEGSLQNPSRPNPMGKMAYTQLYVLNYSWYILTADIGIISKFGRITIEIYLK